jgi:cellulose biosynthesis protein BcsQ
LAVFNHKGGTGKTTTSVQVAAGLADKGARVLLVDTDGQGNVATSLALTAERSLYHVIVMGLSLEQAVIEARPNLDVLPSNETLAAADAVGQRRAWNRHGSLALRTSHRPLWMRQVVHRLRHGESRRGPRDAGVARNVSAIDDL